jgi:hypothetical protein
MGPAPSSLPASVSKLSPLACLLKHWKDLDPNFKKKNSHLSLYWGLASVSLRRPGKVAFTGFLKLQYILQLDLFCKREKKWIKVPYIQLFLHLQDHPEWLHNCDLDLKCWPFFVSHRINMGKEDQKSPLSMTRSPPLLLHTLTYLLSHPNIQNLLLGVSPFNRQW